MPASSRLIPLLCLALGLSACSKPESHSGGTPAAASAGVSAPTAPAATACDMVTAQQMSAILGATVNATPSRPTRAATQCTYMHGEGIGTYADLTVSRGDGQAAMEGLAMAGEMQRGATYAGIGDEAVMNGETLVIRSGADLVQITLSGVDDVPGKARQVFNLVKAKL